MPLLLLLTFLGAVPTPAQAATISPTTIEYSTTTADLILRSYAAKYHLKDPDEFVATAQCESGFDAIIQGDNGKAHGVFQIRLDYHPEITLEEANDPFWAIDWAAQEFSAGHQDLWTCYRQLKSGKGG